MALRDQPYLPLYIQDYLTDEKLNMCSWQAQGIYIKILCILHKQKEYGQIKTKAKQKQNKSKISDFAYILTKQIPCQMNDMENALNELVENDVLNIEDDKLYQKRMIKDGNISIARSNAGSIGGKVGRNSGTKRYYNEPGYLYLIYDKDDKESFKMGISKKPEKRIKGIIRKSERPNLAFRKKWYVKDMGLTEQSVLDYFDDIRDGEWIYGDYDIKEIENQINSIVKTLIKTKSKLKQNPEDKDEYEDESDNDNDNVIKNINIEFENFWELYDKKVSKLKAEPLWNKLSNKDRELIIDYIPEYKLSQSDKYYRKNPDVFLRNKSWKDEIVIKQPTKGLGSSRHIVSDKSQYKDL